MADYTNKFFLAQGAAEPEFLPQKIILPDGKSRYVYSITLEEIESCGYEGPFDVPPYDIKTHKSVWNSASKSFEISELSADDIKKQIEYKVRGQLREIISTENTILSDTTLTTAARNAYYKYFGECQAVLNSTNSIGWEDVPKLKLPNYTTSDQELEAYNTLVTNNLTNWQNYYETAGSRLWHLHEETKDSFTIPSDWNHDKANELAELGVDSDA